MKPGRDQKRALQWLSKGTLMCFDQKSFQAAGGSVSRRVMVGLADRGWIYLQRTPPPTETPTWYATITDAGRKALEDAP